MQIWLSVILTAEGGIEEQLRALRAQQVEGMELIAACAGAVPADLPAGADITVLRAEDAASARNMAMARARGSYVTFVQGMPAPDYISRLREAVQTGGFDVLVFEHARRGGTPDTAGALGLARILPEELMELHLRKPGRYGAGSLLLSAEYLRRTGLCFAAHACDMDFDFTARALAGTQQLLYTQARLYAPACRCFDPACLDGFAHAEALIEALRAQVPKVARRHEKQLAARLYWSALQDAAAMLPMDALRKFARESKAREYAARLCGHPDPVVRCGAWLYRICPAACLALMRLRGKQEKIQK